MGILHDAVSRYWVGALTSIRGHCRPVGLPEACAGPPRLPGE